MAIYIENKNISSSTLLAKIKKAIDNKEIVTWKYDSDGDFIHTTPDKQWEGKAWLRPYTNESNKLKFGILKPNNVNMSKPVYGVYHGRFNEMLLTHFDDDFSMTKATALPVTGIDRC